MLLIKLKYELTLFQVTSLFRMRLNRLHHILVLSNSKENILNVLDMFTFILGNIWFHKEKNVIPVSRVIIGYYEELLLQIFP